MRGISFTKKEAMEKIRARVFKQDPLNAKGESANQVLKEYSEKNWKVVEETQDYYLIFKNTSKFLVGLVISVVFFWTLGGASDAYYKYCEKYEWIKKNQG